MGLFDIFKKKEKTYICVRCKKEITESETKWIGNHRFCENCVAPTRVSKEHVRNEQIEISHEKPEAEQHEKTQNGAMGLFPLVMELTKTANCAPVYGKDVLPLITEYKTICSQNADTSKRYDALIRLVEALNNTLLIVPVRGQDDKALHFSASAAQKFNNDSIVYRGNEMTPAQMFPLFWVVENGNPTIDMDWWDINRISGSEGYHFAEPSNNGNILSPIVANQDNRSFLLCYTGVDQLKTALGATFSGIIGVFTLHDLTTILKQQDSLSGLVINGNLDTHCFLGSDLFP